MHRFFLQQNCISNNEIHFPEDITHQLFRVLRLRAGSQVLVLDGCETEFTVELTEVTGKMAAGKIVSQRKATGEPEISLRMLLCLSQREKFEWMLQKCTEVGVSTFVPLISERSLVQNVSSVNGKMERWSHIIREAAEQSGRSKLPVLENVQFLKDAVNEQNVNSVMRLIPWEKEDATMLSQALSSLAHIKNRQGGDRPQIDIMIGPEGGFSEDEVMTAVAHSFSSVSLGKRIYRMETAAIVSAALVIYEFERDHTVGSSSVGD